MLLLTRHNCIVEAVVGEAGVAFNAGVAEGGVLVAAEGEDSLVHLLGGGVLTLSVVRSLLRLDRVMKIFLAIRPAS